MLQLSVSRCVGSSARHSWHKPVSSEVASTSTWQPRRRSARREGSGPCRTSLRPHESPEEATERRLRESQQVMERVIDIYNEEDWQEQLQAANGKLVVLEVESESVCQTGLEEEVQLQWKDDQAKALEPCQGIKHLFLRTARECPDVKFLSLLADTEEAQPLLDKLGVEVIPTLQFWKDGQRLWEVRGVLGLSEDLGQGVLYYGNTAGGGVQASDFVRELRTRDDLDQFLQAQDERVLTVVDVSLKSATPCVRIFPAVLALARSFKGYAEFARLIGDSSPDSEQLLRDLAIREVPTFIFYRAGKEVGRHVGSSRGDLIGQIMKMQMALGIPPPPPPQAASTPRKRSFRNTKARK